MTRYLTVLLLLVAVIPATAREEAKPTPTKLECRHTKGEARDYVLTWKTSGKVTAKGQPARASSQVLSIWWRDVVGAVDDYGVATLDRRYKAIRYEVRSQLLKVIVDTRDGADDGSKKNDGLRRLFTAAIGRALTVKVDRRGRIISSQGMQAVLDGIRAKHGKESWAILPLAMVEGVLKTEPTTRPLPGHLRVLPETSPDKTSEVLTFRTWSPARTTRLAVEGRRVRKDDRRFLKVKCARFAYEGGLVVRTRSEASAVVKGMRYVTRVNGSSASGELLVDLATGHVLRQTLDLDYTLVHHEMAPSATLTKKTVEAAPTVATEKVTEKITIDRQ